MNNVGFSSFDLLHCNFDYNANSLTKYFDDLIIF